MNIKLKIVAAVSVSLMMLAQTAGAQELYMNMTGYTNTDAKGVTVLVLEKGTDRNNIETEDIKYIEEGRIMPDGTYSIKLPISLDYSDYDLCSNMSNFNLVSSDTPRTKTVYVSNDGNDGNSGESVDAPLKSLGAAYGKLAVAKKIVLMDSINFFTVQSAYDGNLEIEGLTGTEKLILPESTYFHGDVSIDNVVLESENQSVKTQIFANGNSLKIGENVTSSDRFYVYGGTDNEAYTGDTDLTLLGGKYVRIWGGSRNSKIIGATNVTIGGNVNAGDNIDDDSENSCPCYVYGGCQNADVIGKTNVTLDGNAVMGYVVGSSSGGYAYTTDTNIFIKGGKAINVYGGSTDGAYLTNCNTHITMTGGLVEAIFGASVFNSFSGNTFITLLGGDVSRRVFTGCYNDWSWDWLQFFQVYGTTNLVIGPEARLNSKKELSDTNSLNIGVFAGSRQGLTPFAGETNTVIFIDGCYDAQKNCMGDVTGWDDVFGNFPNYTVKANENGVVLPTETAGTVSVLSDKGYYADINGNNVLNGETIINADAVTAVNFVKDFAVNSVNAEKVTDGLKTAVGLNAKNLTGENGPRVIAAVYSEDGRMLAVDIKDTDPNNNAESLDLNFNLESGKNYVVKVMIWDKNEKPLTSVYDILVK